MLHRRPSRRSKSLHAALLFFVTVACVAVGTAPARATDLGWSLYSQSLSTTITGDKPQSKMWYHDGSWWAILRGPTGPAFYEKRLAVWTPCSFIDAVLLSSGEADVKWDGTRLLVLVYTSSPRYFEYTYDATVRAWQLVPGFPVSVPRPSGSETMVLESDSSGRVWVTAEGNRYVNVYYTTSADHRTWSPNPVLLQSGIDIDDITSVIAFGGDKIGVFWSDQARDEFGFRIHRDGDAPTVWQPTEIASSGAGHADDHLHLASDAQGRVYAITKDDFDLMMVHRRETDGTWTLRSDVTGSAVGTRGILVLGEDDGLAYILWTDWTTSPDRIVFRSASLTDLQFGATTALIASSSGDMNNVTSSRASMPQGQIVALAEGASKVWWNGIGTPTPIDLPPPSMPLHPVATLGYEPLRVDLAWSPPASGTPAGYLIDRQVNGGAFVRLTPSLWTATTFVDPAVVGGTLGYKIVAVQNEQAGPPALVSVTYVPPPPPPPGAPLLPGALATEVSLPNGAAAYLLDEGSGQVLADATGRGHIGQLGTKPTSDTSDPAWAAGITGMALRFDGSNDHARVADQADLRQPGSFTVEAWIQRTKLGATHSILAKGDSSRRNFLLELDATNHILFRWQTSKGKDRGTTSTFMLADLGWHHVAGVYDMQQAENRIYVDGVLVHRAPDAGGPATSADPLFIGAKTTSGSVKTTFAGLIDMPRVSAGARYLADFVPETQFLSVLLPAVRLTWMPPAGTPPAGYHVERAQANGSFVRVTSALVTGLEWLDTSPPAENACYRIVALDALGQQSAPSEVACAAAPAAKSTVQSATPVPMIDAGLALRVGPNPFNPTTTIRFHLAAASRVRAAIYDVRGRRVALLADEERPTGDHSIVWHAGTQAASGTYFLLLQAGDRTARQKLVLIE